VILCIRCAGVGAAWTIISSATSFEGRPPMHEEKA